jgi:hypothetical protein
MKPVAFSIRSYQIGFGDCFLLQVTYDTDETRSALIDFGSTRPSKMPSARDEADIARDIKQVSGGKLNVIVATHRHKDHISGFDGESLDILAKLQPDLVVQPWTEDPQVAIDATGPDPQGNPALVNALASMQGFAAQVYAELEEFAAFSSRRKLDVPQYMFDELGFIGEVNISNTKAVEGLIHLGEIAALDPLYAKYDDRLPLDNGVMPGVKVRVLGPPTVRQWPSVRGQRHQDKDEFWHLRRTFWEAHNRSAQLAADGTLFPSAARLDDIPVAARWSVPRVQRIRADQLLQIVRALDRSLNNTSLILLFEIGKKKLLFPGDAQIENWEYALGEAQKDTVKGRELHNLLSTVDVYKVGHHGSLNATPKTLWNMLQKKTTNPDDPDRLTSIMSTKGEVHGSRWKKTEVPRKTLVDALQRHTNHYSTQTQRAKKDYVRTIEFGVS